MMLEAITDFFTGELDKELNTPRPGWRSAYSCTDDTVEAFTLDSVAVANVYRITVEYDGEEWHALDEGPSHDWGSDSWVVGYDAENDAVYTPLRRLRYRVRQSNGRWVNRYRSVPKYKPTDN